MQRKGTSAQSQRVWLRADGQLPDDPVLHACIVTYASDMTLLDTTVLPFGRAGTARHADGEPRPRDVVPPTVPRRRVAAVRPARVFSTTAARGLAGGSIFTRDGRLVVSVVQEGLIRVT